MAAGGSNDPNRQQSGCKYHVMVMLKSLVNSDRVSELESTLVRTRYGTGCAQQCIGSEVCINDSSAQITVK
jgi:hypothetical protein